MAYEAETQRAAGAADARTDAPRGMPGLWPSAAAALLAGAACFVWLMSGVASAPSAQGAGSGMASEIAQVEDQDITAALGTMSGSAAFKSAFQDRRNGCALPLAWVSLQRSPSPQEPAPGQKAGTIRLRSGGYISPIFTLADTPVRIAIPFPAPYEAGRGTLEVMETGGSATIALTPPWRTAPIGAGEAHAVTWAAADRCKLPHG